MLIIDNIIVDTNEWLTKIILCSLKLSWSITVISHFVEIKREE